jgi:flagellar biogenesis protein FliO
MFALMTGKRVFAFALILTSTFAASATGADPKVVKASHEALANESPRETEKATENDLSYSPQWPEPPNTGAMLLRVVVGTVVVLGLCVGTLWFGKPWLQRLQVAGVGNPSFHIEGSVAVGNRAMLYLVRVGETQLVAGTDVSGLKSLIALPPSFKEVLDAQVPESDSDVVTSPRPFDVRSVNRPDSKE